METFRCLGRLGVHALWDKQDSPISAIARTSRACRPTQARRTSVYLSEFVLTMPRPWAQVTSSVGATPAFRVVLGIPTVSTGWFVEPQIRTGNRCVLGHCLRLRLFASIIHGSTLRAGFRGSESTHEQYYLAKKAEQ